MKTGDDLSWIIKPKSRDHLCEMLSKADGSRSVTGFDLSHLSGICRHTPEDLTATVAAGTRFGVMQKGLAKHRQWLPIDPPWSEIMSVGELIAGNWSGPRRFGFGSVRDYLIGLKVILADGSESNSGGQVVKNVAGFDLPKLFVGSHGSLGVIIEATFKLAPLPEHESIRFTKATDGKAVGDLAQEILEKRLLPSILDAHNLNDHGELKDHPILIIGFSGAKEDVESQEANLEKIIKTKSSQTSQLSKSNHLSRTSRTSRKDHYDHSDRFWNYHAPAIRHSVLPTSIGSFLDEIANQPWLARVGNGTFYTSKRLCENEQRARVISKLEGQLKKTFDPKGILPPIPSTTSPRSDQGEGFDHLH